MKKIILFLILISLFGISCTNTYYTSKQSSDILQKGRPLMEKYLKLLDSNLVISDICMYDGAKKGQNIYAGYYASNVLMAYFEKENKTYQAFVNLEDGRFYTDFSSQILENAFKQILEEFFKENGVKIDAKISNLIVDYVIENHNVAINNNPEKTTDVEVYFNAVFALEAMDNPVEYLKKVFSSGEFSSVDIEYSNKKNTDYQLFVGFCQEYKIQSVHYLKINRKIEE